MSGRATLYTFTIIRRAPSPEVAASVPYVVGIVKLDDAPDIKMMTNVVNCSLDDVHIGMSLSVTWDDIEPGLTVPRFEPADAD